MSNFVILSNGFKMPLVGLGCGAIQPDHVENALQSALDSGYRLFDCALLYGNESCIGDAFQNIFNKGIYSREDVFITTKLPMIGNRPDKVEFFMKKSLENLKLPYVDLYLIHFPVGFRSDSDEDFFPKRNGIMQLDPTTDIINLWKAMEQQVEAGRTRSIGLSNFNSLQITKILESAKIQPVNLQIEVHAYFQQKAIRSFCKEHNIIVSAFAPLGSPGRRDAFKPNGIPDVMSDSTVVEIANRHGKTTAQVLLRFMVDEEIVVLPKSSSPERIKTNIDIFDFELDQDEVNALRSLDKGETGRSFDFTKIFIGLELHPENPLRSL